MGAVTTSRDRYLAQLVDLPSCTSGGLYLSVSILLEKRDI